MGLRVAVIGAGSIGRRHIGNLLAMNCQVSVLEPDTERRRKACSQFEIEAATDIREADAVVIASPYDSHLAWAERALDEDIPAFVEKPLGPLSELESWRELANRSRSIVTQVGYQLRFYRDLVSLRANWMHRAIAGEFWCDADMSAWPGHNYGPWLLECSHEIDAALWCGAPSAVRDVKPFGTAGADIRLGEWQVSLDARAEHFERGWRLRTKEDSWGEISYRDLGEFQIENDLAYKDELLHFIECAREGRQTDCPLSEGVKVLEVCAQVEAMARRAA